MLRKPPWLKKRLVTDPKNAEVGRLLKEHNLHTVCESAKCPNKFECFGKGTATFMILGNVCTRHCRFCAVGKGKTEVPDPDEPKNIAMVSKKLNLRHVVLTSVTRDDLPNGGLSHFTASVTALRQYMPGVTVEILTPDFKDVDHAPDDLARIRPDVFNHNIETVPRLYTSVRPEASFQRSLNLLSAVGRLGVLTKSGMMLGLGEGESEVLETMREIRRAGVSILVLGQYLQPSMENADVVEYISPERFQVYRQQAESIGFGYVAAGPFARSSYLAEEAYRTVSNQKDN